MTSPTSVDGQLPDGLIDAFESYERALANNDQDELADAFETDPATMRVDVAGLLVGHEAITSFRVARQSACPKHRTVARASH